MANILGSLFVELKANTAAFLEGMDKASYAAKKAGHEIEQSFSKLGGVASAAFAPFGEMGRAIGETLNSVGEYAGKAFSSFNKMGGGLGLVAGGGAAVVGALAAVEAGVIALTVHTAEQAAKFAELSQMTGVSVEALSGLSYVAKQSGIDTETLAKGLEKMNKSVFAAATAPAGAVNAYTRLGVAVRDSNGNIRSTEEIFKDVAGKFAGMEDGAAKTALAMEMFGKGGAALIPVLNEGKQGISDMLETANALGVVLDKQTAEAAHTFEKSIKTLESAGTGLAYKLMKELVPTLQVVINTIIDGLKTPGSGINMLVQGIGYLTKAFAILGDFAVTVFKQVGAAIGQILGVIFNALYNLGSVVKALATGDFKGAWDALKTTFTEGKAQLSQFLSDSKNMWVDFGSFTSKVWNASLSTTAEPEESKKTKVDLGAQKDPVGEKIKERIKLLEKQAEAQLKVAEAAQQSTADARLAEANKKSDEFIGKLKEQAKGRKDLIAEIDRQAEHIKALTAVERVATDAAGLGGELDKQTKKFNEQIAAIQNLTAAYRQGGFAVVLADVDKALADERQKIDDLQSEYDLLSRKPGVTADQLKRLQAVIDQANRTFEEHRQQLIKTKQANYDLEIAQSADKLKTQIDGLKLLNAAYLRSADAVRAAAVEVQVLNWAQAHPGATPEQINAIREQYKKLGEQEYANQIAQESGSYNIQKLYQDEMDKLQRIRDVLVKNGSDTLLIDAAMQDANEKLLHQWDEAALKVGSIGDRFKAVFNEIILQGQHTAEQIFQALGKTIDDLTTKLAEFVVTGKADFKSLFQSLQQEIAKAAFQKMLSAALSKVPGLGEIPGLKKAAGEQNDGHDELHPLYVKPVSGGLGIPGLSGSGTGDSEGGDESGAGGFQDALGGILGKIGSVFSSIFGTITGVVGKVISTIASVVSSIGKFIGGIFGGFLAGGGDVVPGKAYIVGEHHPEFFLPKQSGTVVPTMQDVFGGKRPVLYAPVYNINTPNADSFRRSQSQIISEAYGHLALAHARNG